MGMTAPHGAPAGHCRVLVHIGMHKTGSSSIQHYLDSVRDGPGFRYLDLGRGANHSGAMYAAFASAPAEYYAFKRRQWTAGQVAAMRQEVRDALAVQLRQDGPILRIISGEDITALDPDGLGDLRRFLIERAGAHEILAYVRPPRSFMESAFQQRVRGGLARLNFASLHPGYRKRFLKFEQVFGRARMRLLPFCRPSLVDGDVVADFCARAGIPAPGQGLPQLNRGLSRRAVALLYTYRKHAAAYGAGAEAIRENKAMLDALALLPGPRLRFAGPAVDEVLQRFARDQQWVEARLGVPLAEEPVQAGDAVDSEEALLRYDEQQIAWLRQWADVPGLSPWMSPEAMAQALGSAAPAMVEAYKASRKRQRLAAAALEQASMASGRCTPATGAGGQDRAS